jgi:hypothetical protein
VPSADTSPTAATTVNDLLFLFFFWLIFHDRNLEPAGIAAEKPGPETGHLCGENLEREV